MEFDKIVFAENLTRHIQQTGKKISDVEKELGVSVGFISRLVKPDTKYNVSADTLCKAADMFKVSMDSLVKKPSEDESANETYIVSFIDKLLEQTEDKALEWSRLTLDDIDSIYDGNMGMQFPIYTFCGKKMDGRYPSEEDMEQYGIARSRAGVESLKYFTAIGAYASPEGFAFFVKIDDVHTLYLLKSRTYIDEADECAFYYEMCFVDSSGYRSDNIDGCLYTELPKVREVPHYVTPICNTLQMNRDSIAYMKIKELYSDISSLFDYSRVSKDARAIIDMFMLGETAVATETQKAVYTEADEELPF